MGSVELGTAATPPGPPRAHRPPARAGHTSPKETQTERSMGATRPLATPLLPPTHPDPRGVLPKPRCHPTPPPPAPHQAHGVLSQRGSPGPILPHRAPPQGHSSHHPVAPRDGGGTRAGAAGTPQVRTVLQWGGGSGTPRGGV